MKRNRIDVDDIEEFEENEEYSRTEEPPSKRKLLNFENSFMFKCELSCTKKNTVVRFELVNGVTLNSTLMSHLSERSPNLKFKVSDFINKRALLSYENENPAEFEVYGLDSNGSCLMTYLKGVLARKNEVAVMPIPESNFQILLFDKEEKDLFEPVLSAFVVPKYNLILDLDETLIRARIIDEKIQNLNGYYFEVENCKYLCAIRPGTEQLLKWASSIFNVYIFTNAVFDYAKKVLNILDPKKEHLLKHISSEKDLGNLLKTRENLQKISNSKFGIKNLAQFSLDSTYSVILDDDINVWIEKANVLPFQKVANLQNGKEFYLTVRDETWKRLEDLSEYKYIQNQRVKQ